MQNLSWFHQNFCKKFQTGSEHASWEQGYHGANNCHYPGYPEQRPCQISVPGPLSLCLSPFYFIIHRDRQQTELRCPGVREICLASIFLLLCVSQLRFERHLSVHKSFLNTWGEWNRRRQHWKFCQPCSCKTYCYAVL